MSGYEIPTTEPIRITAGDAVQWTIALDDYSPDDGWVLSYAFVCPTDQHLETASDNGDGTFLVSLSTTDTSGLTPGTYAWKARVTKDGAPHVVRTGRLEVLADFAAGGYSAGYDARSTNKKILDALEAMLVGRASQDQVSMSIAGRSISRMSMQEITEAIDVFRSRVAAEVRAERRALGLPSSKHTRARF